MRNSAKNKTQDRGRVLLKQIVADKRQTCHVKKNFIRIGYISKEPEDFNSLLYLMKWPQFLNSCVGLKVFIDYLCNH